MGSETGVCGGEVNHIADLYPYCFFRKFSLHFILYDQGVLEDEITTIQTFHTDTPLLDIRQ